ncbi:unnamed protein product [Sympodiomycopsis kandeliae]
MADDDGAVPGQLDASEAIIVAELVPPPPGKKGVGLATLSTMEAYILAFLEFEGIKGPTPKTKKAYRKILNHNARILGWYPTYRKERLFLTDSQSELLLCGVWAVISRGFAHDFERTITLLSRHQFLLLLNLKGFRALSWVDDNDRLPQNVGRYLRWNMVKIELLPYI